MYVTIQADNSELLELAERIRGIGLVAGRRAVVYLRDDLPSIKLQALTEAVITAGDFPTPYAEHLERSLGHIQMTAYVTDDDINISFTDPEELGDLQDLERGFHYRAIDGSDYPQGFRVTDPPKVGLPGPDQDLYAYQSQSGDRREEYWEAIKRGDTTFPVEFNVGGNRGANGRFSGSSGKKRTQQMPIPGQPHTEVDTYRARTIEWGGRYPEWILLNNGYGDSSPGGFDFYLRQIVESVGYQYYERALRELIELIEAKGYVLKGKAIRQPAGASGGRGGEYAPYVNIEDILGG